MMNDPKDLDELQAQVAEWAATNFPEATSLQCALGVSEECGELAHSILKRDQGIRGTAEEHANAAQDAIGDICVFLMHLCVLNKWSFNECLETTWRTVRERNWSKHPSNGKAA